MWLSFPEICSELGAAIGLIPLIAILEQVAIAKTFGKFPPQVSDVKSLLFNIFPNFISQIRLEENERTLLRK